MVAIAILAAGMAALSQVIGASRRLESRSRNVTTATCLARLRMEEALLTLRGARAVPTDLTGDGEKEFDGFAWRCAFEPTTHGTRAVVKVRVTVSWHEKTGEQSFDLATLVRAPATGGGT